MAWFLRAIERIDHQWDCRWGATAYGVEPDEASAIGRLREIAADLARDGEACELFLHPADGTVERIHP
jgi:hypothetical protein